jgi:ATP-dependent RNA helicase SUPV3L1/SUV3
MADLGRITAVLGPTNTGKTHYAIERMLGYRSGIIGLPLRLLAREVYDRIVAVRGPSVVALVTGEERIVPDRTAYWVCTVEAMPEGMGADFLAVDEIQLCNDPERGHVFTDRLLRARGTHETLFLGADTMRPVIAELLPKAQFMRRERLSELSYSGSRKISRMPARSAIVGFSVDNVYAIAELLRRQKGGAAVVMGALSPRTRNAQVEMYQNGDVDYLVATDAIGMGLNLDIDHVAFSATVKFDGRRMRPLDASEMAQIAGRAGRHMSHGTFGVTGEARPLSEEMVEAITEHRFSPVKKLQWRNPRLEFGNVETLIRSLERGPDDSLLVKARMADDLGALKFLSASDELTGRVNSPGDVKRLWDVCRIPDFRGISVAEHAALLEQIYTYLYDVNRVPDDWLAAQVKRLDRSDGDIDTLSKRLAYIRTWTYVAQRKGWVDDEAHWREATRAVEDRLSDALHERLTQRFVDRRTSVLLRRLKQKEGLVANVNDTGEVMVEGEFVGRLDGFRFSQDKAANQEEAKTLRQASLLALKPEFHLRADRFYNAPDTEIDFTEQGGLMWGEHAVGKLVAGAEPMKPQVQAFVDEEAGEDVATKVTRRLQHFIDRKIAAAFEPLLAMSRDEALTGLARGFAFRLVESQGVLTRDEIASEVKELDQDARGALRKHGVRFGQFTIFMPLLLKPAPTRLRLVLWGLSAGHAEFAESPPPGLVTIPAVTGADAGYYTMSGYRLAGARAIRIDMLERLADMLRAEDSRGGFEANPDMLSITGMTLEQFADLMGGLGYKAEKAERPKVKAVAAAEKPAEAAAEVKAETAADAPADAAAEAAETAPEAVAEAAAETAAETAPEAVADAAAETAPVVEEARAETESGAEAKAEAKPAEAEAAPEAEAAVEAEAGAAEAAADTAAEPAAEVELESFFTFTWGGRANRRNAGREGGRAGGGRRQGNADAAGEGARPRGRGKQGDKAAGRQGGKPGGKTGGKPGGKQGGKRGDGPRGDKAKKFEARPPRREKPIDPDNPFAAALMGLKDKG